MSDRINTLYEELKDQYLPVTREDAIALITAKPEGWVQQCKSVKCYLKKQHPSHKVRKHVRELREEARKDYL